MHEQTKNERKSERKLERKNERKTNETKKKDVETNKGRNTERIHRTNE